MCLAALPGLILAASRRPEAPAFIENFFQKTFNLGDSWWLAGLAMLLACVAVFAFIAVFALIAVWMERKVSAHMQCRLGPMEVGPHGILQTMADGAKLFVKEDFIPRLADRALFVIAPVIVFTGVFIRFVPIPFGENLIASDLNLGLFFLASVGSVEVIGVIMAGWASNNKWSLFGTIRTATQMVSYEIPIGIAFVTVAVNAGSLSLVEIVDGQRHSVLSWYIFRDPFLFILCIIYVIASLAECKRSPFDLPEAESELVSGFHTEYSGMRFALFFMAEYAAMYLVSAIAVVAFFGGWFTGIPPIDRIGEGAGAGGFAMALGFAIKVLVIIGKAMGIVFVQMWVRWTLPRVRLDQMMHVCLKVLLPISMACLVGSAFWKLLTGGRYFFGLISPDWFGW